MRKIFTIRQLAEIAGVSHTTVSLAFRNDPSITPATRNRILSLAKENGYSRDPLVSTLMNQLRVSGLKGGLEKLAYLTFWATRDGWREHVNDNEYFIGARDRGMERGYELEPFWAKEPGYSSARVSRILYTRGVRGVIFGPLPRHLGHVSLHWEDFACAGLGLTICRPRLHQVTQSFYDGMMLALRKLQRYGYKRIGFVNSAMFDKKVKHGWLAAFLTYQSELPAEQRVPPLLVPEWNFEVPVSTRRFPGSLDIGLHALCSGLIWNPKPFNQWIKKYRPDVIVSNTAHPLVFARELGLRVPEDIGFASVDKLLDSDPWAGIRQPQRAMGAEAIDLVTELLQNNELGLPQHAKTVLVEASWCDGPTVVSQGG